MFTGLIADLGRVQGIEATPDGAALRIATALVAELGEGDSVAVNGVCLTATGVGEAAFTAEVMNQTLSLTSLGALQDGARVNLELAVRAADRLGGHIVQGHVDGVGGVTEVMQDGFARRITIELPYDLLRDVVEHGSLAVDGVSLTVAAIDGPHVTVSLIPETLARTNLGQAKIGTPVNLEVDVMAKYAEKALQAVIPAGEERRR